MKIDLWLLSFMRFFFITDYIKFMLCVLWEIYSFRFILHVQFSQSQQQQSRLNQWKLPAPDKEDTGDFSRAPGSTSKPLTSSPNMNPLGLTQPDG